MIDDLEIINRISRPNGYEGYSFDSKKIPYAGYDYRCNQLFIRLDTGDGVYLSNVEENVWHDFVDAEDTLGFFFEHILDKYDYEIETE